MRFASQGGQLHGGVSPYRRRFVQWRLSSLKRVAADGEAAPDSPDFNGFSKAAQVSGFKNGKSAMDAKAIFLSDLFSGRQRTFAIPAYRRGYVWREPECARLFADVEAIAGGGAGHFLGSIVLASSGEKNAVTEEFTVVDGQQRLTSLLLLLKAVHDLASNDDVKKAIWYYNLINEHAGDDRHRFKLRPEESGASSAWADVIEGRKPGNPSSGLWENYELFRRKVEGGPHTPEEIFEAVGRLKIVRLMLKHDDGGLQAVFETLNSAGLSLTLGDNVRDFLLLSCSSQVMRSLLHGECWLKIEDRLKTPQAVAEFIRDYLTMKTGRAFDMPEAYETFKGLFRVSRGDRDGALEDSLQELCRLSEYYSLFLQSGSGDEKLDRVLGQFRLLDA
ncbi:MAG: DUF262 domain-containing protein, partial [Deltaproteobacteria bacterium]|nr:DUF262 domain-containing protein [Deltaproteobacteria bacterium]